MPSCSVCGFPKAGRHYNAVCCFPCKTFFRKTTRLKLNLKCINDGNCSVKALDRKSCGACRYSKCIDAGLNPKLIQSDRSLDKKTTNNKPSSQNDFICSSELIPVDINVPFDGALGFRNMLQLPDINNLSSLLHYFNKVDILIDEFCDTHYNHVHSCPPNFFNHNLSLEEAFLYEPRKLSRRTKMLWKAESWLMFADFSPIWCRFILNYVDWASHIQETRELDADDRLRFLVNRTFVSGALISAHRTLKYAKNKRCLLTSGGSYMPVDVEDLEGYEVEDGMKMAVEIVSNTWSTVLEPMAELQMNDDEFVLLRLIAFFGQCSKLSAKGREIIRAAQERYQSYLIDYLKSKYEPMVAIDRMTRILSFLPLIENAVMINDNQMMQIVLCDLAGMKSDLTYKLYVSRELRS
ncbi:Nuclear hormone receptor family member nhr-34 [Aphelenchoides besseyi]|nr:Nuclear hormone receptor family member nhr-34 [Aphelenchoides besseyi]KAI6219413.1 Nuclear hormone receptor family member nhr-34 [Aphelenchoides besseyi]